MDNPSGYVYSSFSIYFAESFFPKGDRMAQLLNAAGSGGVPWPLWCSEAQLNIWIFGALRAKSVGREDAFFWYVTVYRNLATRVSSQAGYEAPFAHAAKLGGALSHE